MQLRSGPWKINRWLLMAEALSMSNETALENELPFFPDFFLIGAPRCGTTAMSSYLRHHPKICFSSPKEPHYFSLLRKLLPDMTVQDYLDHCYAHYDPRQHQVLGEGSVSYLYDSNAIGEILQFNPQAKFIIMTRNPVDLVYSYHSRLVALLDEDEEDFVNAWRLQEIRAKGKKLPNACRNPFLLQYGEIGQVGKYLEKLFQQVPREQCLVLVFDDFIEDPLETYRKILDFIGVEYDGRTGFPPNAGNKYPRYKWLQRILKRPPVQMASFVATLNSQRQRKKLKKRSPMKRLRKWLIHKNEVYRPRKLLPEEIRQELIRFFSDDIDLLGKLIGRDLSQWKQLF